MPSEERDAEMLGVPVWITRRRAGPEDNEHVRRWITFSRRSAASELHRLHSEPVAVAMVEVVEAARAYRAFAQPRQHTMTPETIAKWHRVKDAFYSALDNLDAALGGGRNEL